MNRNKWGHLRSRFRSNIMSCQAHCAVSNKVNSDAKREQNTLCLLMVVAAKSQCKGDIRPGMHGELGHFCNQSTKDNVKHRNTYSWN